MEVEKLFITPDISIREAIKQLDQTAKRLLVVTEQKKLVGIVTDGDIRRCILKNEDFSSPIQMIMNTDPVFLKKEDSHLALEVMKEKKIEGIPLINEYKEVIDIVFWNEINDQQHYNDRMIQTPVVIMAGGKGSRLYPYTKIIPKPLIPIGDIPIAERIMNKFMEYGFHNFYFTINYKKDMIKAYFSGDIPYHLHFIEEERPMGTAGSLELLKDCIKGSFIVSNCDILLDINYSKLLFYHKTHQNKITVVTAIKSYEIPYGVVTLDKFGIIKTLSEKPKYEALVNTGFYVMEDDVVKYIPHNEYFDMTELILECMRNGERIGAYPVMDSNWLDMGEFSEMKKMTERLKL